MQREYSERLRRWEKAGFIFLLASAWCLNRWFDIGPYYSIDFYAIVLFAFLYLVDVTAWGEKVLENLEALNQHNERERKVQDAREEWEEWFEEMRLDAEEFGDYAATVTVGRSATQSPALPIYLARVP